jgi:hypothetical protein
MTALSRAAGMTVTADAATEADPSAARTDLGSQRAVPGLFGAVSVTMLLRTWELHASSRCGIAPR